MINAGHCGHPQAVPLQMIGYDHRCRATHGIAHDAEPCQAFPLVVICVALFLDG